ncbi:hypothetical protein ACXGQW_04580 [Wenyingzhuangia sp. IMCC45533]
MKKYITIILLIFLSACIKEIDNDGPCNEDQNAMVNDRCARAFISAGNYSKTGSTSEKVTITFNVSGTSSVSLFFNDTDSLLEEGSFTSGQNNFTASYGFSGKESQKRLSIKITSIDRTNRKISGSFSFDGTFAENFQSLPVSYNGTFNNVQF